MKLEITGFELHNIVRDARGLRTRNGLVSIQTPTAGTVYVGGFTVESPFTSEPWHYLFEQSTTTSVVTLRVYTEEFLELFSFTVGPCSSRPIITAGAQTNQVMVNSPAFSGPLYGLVGGGVVQATKSASEIEGTTALDIPQGHLATFGDRFAIAAGNLVYFNDAGVDPRTFVAENIASFPGTVYDLLQGPGGGLYVFTSAGVYVMAADALGQGQEVAGFISRVPGIETSRPRNAAASGGRAAVLAKTGVQVIDGPFIPVLGGKTRRYTSRVVDVEDLRMSGELFATPRGFIVGFQAARAVYLDIDLDAQTATWTTNSTQSLNVAGTLRSRDGDLLVILRDRIVMPIGNADWSGSIVGSAAGPLPMPVGESPVVRRVTMSSANVGEAVGVAVNGTSDTSTCPTRTTDTTIGTSTWSASVKFAGRALRSSRLSFRERSQEPVVEVTATGGNRRIDASIDVEVAGQAIRRKDARG